MTSAADLNLWRIPVTYAEIGHTQASDLVARPPRGFRAVERRVRIGHGDERWQYAWVQVMSWGLKRRAGFRVQQLPAPAAVLENTYVPVSFADDGTPLATADTLAEEQVYSPSGAELVRPGDTAILRLGWRALSIREPVRIVQVVEEARTRGFVYGTLPGHPLRGEESFIVEFTDDDAVWLVIRSFSRPANILWWATTPILRVAQLVFLRRYERALTGPIEDESLG